MIHMFLDYVEICFWFFTIVRAGELSLGVFLHTPHHSYSCIQITKMIPKRYFLFQNAYSEKTTLHFEISIPEWIFSLPKTSS